MTEPPKLPGHGHAVYGVEHLVYDGTRWVPYDDTVERLTAGADPTPVEPGAWPTPRQYIHRWNQMTEAERLVEAEAILELKRAEYYRPIQPPRHA